MLEKLFTSKNRVEILKYLLFEKNNTYIREISRTLKISPSSVKKEIDNFFSIGLIIQDNRTIMLNKSCNFTEDLKNIFMKTDYIAYPLKKALDDKRVKIALIFGSFPNKNANISSDIDVLIIGNLKQSEAFAMLKKTEKEINKEISPIVWSIESLRKNKDTGLFKEIMKKNRIFIKGDDDELRKIIG